MTAHEARARTGPRRLDVGLMAVARLKPGRGTIESCCAALHGLWLLDPLPGWAPTRGPLRRVALAPKHHLADPALAARLLGVGLDALLTGRDAGPPTLRDGDLTGRLFESLVALSVRTYAQAAEARAYHLRTRNGDHEVDLILQRDACSTPSSSPPAATPKPLQSRLRIMCATTLPMRA